MVCDVGEYGRSGAHRGRSLSSAVACLNYEHSLALLTYTCHDKCLFKVFAKVGK